MDNEILGLRGKPCKGMVVMIALSCNPICSPQNENLNLLVRIKSLNIFLYNSFKKTEKCIGPNKVFLVLGGWTGLIVRTAFGVKKI